MNGPAQVCLPLSALSPVFYCWEAVLIGRERKRKKERDSPSYFGFPLEVLSFALPESYQGHNHGSLLRSIF